MSAVDSKVDSHQSVVKDMDPCAICGPPAAGLLVVQSCPRHGRPTKLPAQGSVLNFAAEDTDDIRASMVSFQREFDRATAQRAAQKAAFERLRNEPAKRRHRLSESDYRSPPPSK